MEARHVLHGPAARREARRLVDEPFQIAMQRVFAHETTRLVVDVNDRADVRAAEHGNRRVGKERFCRDDVRAFAPAQHHVHLAIALILGDEAHRCVAYELDA